MSFCGSFGQCNFAVLKFCGLCAAVLGALQLVQFMQLCGHCGYMSAWQMQFGFEIYITYAAHAVCSFEHYVVYAVQFWVPSPIKTAVRFNAVQAVHAVFSKLHKLLTCHSTFSLD